MNAHVDGAPAYGYPVVGHCPRHAPKWNHAIANEDLLMPVVTGTLQQDNTVVQL